MTKEEMKKRMEEIENHRFSLAMIDVWNAKIAETDSKLFKEWLALKKEIEKN